MPARITAQKFIDGLQALPQPDLRAADTQAQITLHREAVLALTLKLQAHQVRYNGPHPLCTFPDRSGALMTAEPGPGDPFGVTPSHRQVYRALDAFEVETLLWQNREVQGAVFLGQKAIDDDNFWAAQGQLQRVLTDQLRSVLRHPQAFNVHGHARQLIQCSAQVDARSFSEEEQDRLERERREALNESERAAENQAVRVARLGALNIEAVPGGVPATQRLAWLAAVATRPHLEEGRWMEVTFHLAYVQLRSQSGPVRTELYLLHPRLGYGQAYAAMLTDLARCTRRAQAGEADPWPHDHRDWFSGRTKAVDPRGDMDRG